MRSAGGPLRSADVTSGDLSQYVASTATGLPAATGSLKVDLAKALAGQTADDFTLRDGDVLTVPQLKGWKDIGATVAIVREVAKPDFYGIRPGYPLVLFLGAPARLL